jgi:hypothetical protein
MLLLCAALAGCGDGRQQPAAGSAPRAAQGADSYARLSRTDFNRRAAELYLPLFWRSDADGDGKLDPDELVALWGIAGGGRIADYVEDGAFTAAFTEAYERMVRPPVAKGLSAAERKRREAVREELAQGRPTLVESDFRKAPEAERALVESVLAAAAIVERIFARQKGVEGLAAQVPEDDPASHMLMYRNQGPFCVSPKMQSDPDCSALPERPPKISGLYPAHIQSGTDTRFCTLLEQRADAAELLDPFTVVVARDGDANANAATADLDAVPYNVAYRAEMREISALLMRAAGMLPDTEAPLQLYLAAAAESFLSNDWRPADEAWARMNATNSSWYLRIGPDEVYEDPCARKAMFHVSFARIDPAGLEWQKKLEPRRTGMEAEVAVLAGAPYEARPVTFRLPDFIDVVLNAGDSRQSLGGTLGQSLPNWGPVANEGRGRTVAMVNLFTDADSRSSWEATASSLFCAGAMEQAAFEPELGTMTTVLHEAAHNLGPAHEYRVGAQTAAELFGGQMASMMEELKAQTAALYFTDWLVDEGLLEAEQAARARLWDIAWAFGHIATGMYDAEGGSKPYAQLASIQLGVLAGEGVLVWRPGLPAANRTDKGCFDVDHARWKPAVRKLAERVLHIKAAGDRAGAASLKAEFVDVGGEWAQRREVIRERYLRAPKATLVYSIEY